MKSIIETIPEGNIVLFEEIDTCAFLNKRDCIDKEKVKKMYDEYQSLKDAEEKRRKTHTDNAKRNGLTNFIDQPDEAEYTDDDDEDEDENENEDEKNAKTKTKDIKSNIITNEENKIKEILENGGKETKGFDMNLDRDITIYGSYVKKEMAHILEILDGYNYLYNTIVIMYTNYIDKIDSAVIRPGRIDHKILLSYADIYQVKKLYQLYYKQDIPTDIAKKIVERNVTTSFLINTCIIPCFHDIKKSITLALTQSTEI